MILDFEASVSEVNGLWLVFPQNNNHKYFVPEEKVSALHECDDDVLIYLVSKTSGVEQFRIENTTLEDVKDVIDFDSYLAVLNQDDEKMLISPRGINAVRIQEDFNPTLEIRVASQDQIWGEGHGSLAFIPQETTPELQFFIDTLPDTKSRYGWKRSAVV
jgi:hypothetical protein